MAGGVFSEAQLFGMTIRESASDGSDFTNPAADYRRLFLGEDGLLHVKDSAGVVTGPYTGGTVDYVLCEGRLTLTTGVAVTTADVTAATTLYFTPYRGSRISTYSGAVWSTSTFTEKSITLASLTAGLPYDCFIVDSTLALELLAWTNTTTRATALVLQDGVLVKSGATTRRYLGTICIAATGQCEDSVLKRFVFNYYNQLQRPMRAVDTTDTWTYATAAWRQARATAANKVEYVCGISEALVRADVQGGQQSVSTAAGINGIGVDSTTVNSAQLNNQAFAPGSAGTRLTQLASYRGWPGIGYHYLAWLEYASSGATITFVGDDGQTGLAQSGISAEIWA
jgi:hypothetical protein